MWSVVDAPAAADNLAPLAIPNLPLDPMPIDQPHSMNNSIKENNESMLDLMPKSTWDKDDQCKHKAGVELLLWALKQNLNAPISDRCYNLFKRTHKRYKAAKTTKDEDWCEWILPRLEATYINLSCIYGDNIISRMNILMGILDIPDSTILQNGFWSSFYKKKCSLNYKQAPLEEMHENKATLFESVLKRCEVLYRVKQWLVEMTFWKEYQEAKGDPDAIASINLPISLLWFMYEHANFIQNVCLCSHYKINATAKDGTSTSQLIPRQLLVPARWKLFFTKIYKNKKAMPYFLMYNTIGQDEVINAYFLEKGITKPQSLYIKAKYFSAMTEVQILVIEQMIAYITDFVISYPLNAIAIPGQYGFNLHSIHLCVTDIINVIRARTEALIKLIAKRKNDFVIRAENENDNEDKSNVNPDPNNLDDQLLPDRHATTAEKIQFKVSQAITLFINNLANPSCGTDCIFDSIWCTNVSTHPDTLPLSAASKMGAVSSYKPKHNKLTHIKFRGWAGQSQQWRNAATTYTLSLCNPDYIVLHGASDRDNQRFVSTLLNQYLDALTLRLDQIEQFTDLLPQLTEKGDFWKESDVYMSKPWKDVSRGKQRRPNWSHNVCYGRTYFAMNALQMQRRESVPYFWTSKRAQESGMDVQDLGEEPHGDIWNNSDDEKVDNDLVIAQSKSKSKRKGQNKHKAKPTTDSTITVKTKTHSKNKPPMKQSSKKSTGIRSKLPKRHQKQKQQHNEDEDSDSVSIDSMSSGLEQIVAVANSGKSTKKSTKEKSLFDSDKEFYLSGVDSSDETPIVSAADKLLQRTAAAAQKFKSLHRFGTKKKTKTLPTAPSSERSTIMFASFSQENQYANAIKPWSVAEEPNVNTKSTNKFKSIARPVPTIESNLAGFTLKTRSKRKGSKSKKSGKRKDTDQDIDLTYSKPDSKRRKKMSRKKGSTPPDKREL